MVNMVEMLNMVWVTTGLKIKGYAHIYIWDVTGRKHKKVLTVTAFGKGNWETGEKGGKEIYLSPYTGLNPLDLVFCALLPSQKLHLKNRSERI